MSQIPIDANARGALLEAVADFETFCITVDVALPALFRCGNRDLEMRAAWIAGQAAQMRKALEVAVEQTCEAGSRRLPAIPAPEKITVPVFRSKR